MSWRGMQCGVGEERENTGLMSEKKIDVRLKKLASGSPDESRS